MENCRNAIEEIVLEEINTQLNRLGQDARRNINMGEVVAYALNRLPPMYATTQKGWIQQRKLARDRLQHQVNSAVRQALMGVRRDPLRTSDPLPPTELQSQARSLLKLQRILDRDDLKWKDVPPAVAAAIATPEARLIPRQPASFARRSVQDIKSYLRRSKSYKPRSSDNSVRVSEQDFRASSEVREFESYMAGAVYNYSNILENLVTSVALRQIAKLNPEVVDQLNMDDVVAYALNRLPPMYATSDRGLKKLRQKIKDEMTHEIAAVVRRAVSKIAQEPVRLLPPLPFERFNDEQDEALSKLQEILKRKDITWQNVADVIEAVLDNGGLQGLDSPTTTQMGH
ncbi:Late competence development protein ComFB [Thalassoporum mexicanum PCC 7367]|uniref:late competence development ComFB family protein n=1 Tax=Thalassoporum mexicanum TaxID=3457544 RepID=UPI00029FEB99|nr:late competence development ComFB family protein [Pseudanabaena sp. PCC 7367]AFY69180.1 Late competence development protein ComFB [Pseudanabaena sp. PCC 7367]